MAEKVTNQSVFEQIMRRAERAVTQDELEVIFKQVLKIVEQNVKTTQEIDRQVTDILKSVKDTSDNSSQDLKTRIETLFQQAREKDDERVAKLESAVGEKIASMKDGVDGISPDADDVTNEVLSRIKLPEQKETILDTPEEVVEKVNSSETKIKKDQVEGLEEMEGRIKTSSGGGVSDLRIQQAFKYILKTQAPAGDIDGVNLSYTVTQPIFAILAFSINGEVIAQLPNYTISGNTITFSTALPAAYSGKDFECKFI